MAPQFFFDMSDIDLDGMLYDVDEIQSVNPHRGHMRQLDGVIWASEDNSLALGYKDTHDDEFWVPGHIPGRPLFPGVLMIEAAAQLAGFMMIKRSGDLGFVGFTGCDNVKFRKQVAPNERLYLLGREVKFGPRRMICDIQGCVRGDLIFEARIKGMPI